MRWKDGTVDRFSMSDATVGEVEDEDRLRVDRASKLNSKKIREVEGT